MKRKNGGAKQVQWNYYDAKNSNSTRTCMMANEWWQKNGIVSVPLYRLNLLFSLFGEYSFFAL